MAMSTEKDPTCVVEMLNCLRPVHERNMKRGSSVATRLQFESSVNESYRSSRRNYSYERSGSSVKRSRHSHLDSSVPESPWEYQLMKANLLKANSQIEAQENIINKLHAVRREQELVFENEKAGLRVQIDDSQKMVRDLESRIETLSRRSRDSREELAEVRAELAAAELSRSADLQALEKLNAELRVHLDEVQANALKTSASSNKTITQLEAELEMERQEKEGLEKRVAELEGRLREARQSTQQAEVLAQQLLEAQQRMRSLEQAQEEGREAAALAVQQQSKLLQYPRMERELATLREDNTRLRTLIQEKLLLKEKLFTLQSELNMSEQRGRELVQLQTVHAATVVRLEEWLTLARDVAAETPRDVRQMLDKLQQRELTLTADAGEYKSRLKVALESKAQVCAELEDVRKQSEKLRSTLEVQKSYTHRLSKKLQLVQVERDSYRTTLDNYERELTVPSTGAMMSALHEQQRARVESLEKALGGYREFTSKLEAELDRDKKEAAGGDQQEALASLRTERDALLQQVGDQRRRVQELELELQYRALKGDFNVAKTKVLHMRMNPQTEAESDRADELALLRTECARLRERLRLVQDGQAAVADLTLVTDERLQASNSAEVQELRAQVKSLELKLQRLTEAFKATSNEFREIVYSVLGYRIDRRENHEYHLRSMYADSPDDVLTFKYNVSTGDVELMGTPFSHTLESLIDLHLRRQHSIPVFLSAVTLDLFSQQTFTGGITTPDATGGS